MLILAIGLLAFSCKNTSFIKRKYVNGNYISIGGKPTEPKEKQINSEKVKPIPAPILATAKNENYIVNTIICDYEYVELNSAVFEDSIGVNRNYVQSVNKPFISIINAELKNKPFPFRLIDLSYWYDDDPIAGKIRILYLIMLGIIVLGLPILYFLGKYSSINPYVFPIIFGLLILIVFLLLITSYILNLIRWRRYKS